MQEFVICSPAPSEPESNKKDSGLNDIPNGKKNDGAATDVETVRGRCECADRGRELATLCAVIKGDMAKSNEQECATKKKKKKMQRMFLCIFQVCPMHLLPSLRRGRDRR